MLSAQSTWRRVIAFTTLCEMTSTWARIMSPWDMVAYLALKFVLKTLFRPNCYTSTRHCINDSINSIITLEILFLKKKKKRKEKMLPLFKKPHVLVVTSSTGTKKFSQHRESRGMICLLIFIFFNYNSCPWLSPR
jgi:hypothetical protein